MNKVLLVFLTCCISALAFSSLAAEPRQQPSEQERARTVYIFHQPIVMLQAKFGLTTPEERVLRIRNTLRNFTQADLREPLKIVAITRYNEFNVQIMSPNFVLQPDDAVRVPKENWYAAPAIPPEGAAPRNS